MKMISSKSLRGCYEFRSAQTLQNFFPTQLWVLLDLHHQLELLLFSEMISKNLRSSLWISNLRVWQLYKQMMRDYRLLRKKNTQENIKSRTIISYHFQKRRPPLNLHNFQDNSQSHISIPWTETRSNVEDSWDINTSLYISVATKNILPTVFLTFIMNDAVSRQFKERITWDSDREKDLGCGVSCLWLSTKFSPRFPL